MRYVLFAKKVHLDNKGRYVFIVNRIHFNSNMHTSILSEGYSNISLGDTSLIVEEIP